MRTRKMEQGFTLVEIMIVVAIIALLAAIAIPNLLRAKMTSNDALAKATLRAMSTAAESYGTSNNGNYPANEAVLIGAAPPYLNKTYCTTTQSGYAFTCSFTVGSYALTATPVSVGTSGTTTYTMTTGGILSP